ncbi:MAG: hypothetical protein U1F65_07100 [Verrucomicrobiota bacterium]
MKNIIATGATIASLAASSSSQAAVEVIVAGGNASRAVQFDRASNILSGFTVYVKDANTRSFVGGTLNGNPGLGVVNLHFALNGASGGLQKLRDQTTEPLAYLSNGSSNGVPVLTVSGSYPETVGVDGSIFNAAPTLVIPFGFIKNAAKSPNLANVTNLTQRQFVYLQGASGTLPSAFFGGSSTTDRVYLVGRDTAAAVRQVIDANVYFTGTPSFWTTNRATYQTNAAFNAAFNNAFSSAAIGAPVPNPLGGHNSGALVVSDLNVLTNAIGTVASGDFGSFTTLSYEGYQPTVQNVAKGYYPIWGYENWYTRNTGAGQPSANQSLVITALLNAVTDFTYQHTAGNTFDAGKFVPIGDLQVERTQEGGPITSLLY